MYVHTGPGRAGNDALSEVGVGGCGFDADTTTPRTMRMTHTMAARFG